MSLRAYRDVLTRPVLTWSGVAVGARMPVAMAPLAVVFLVRERPGGYTLGALLAAVYVLGEIVGAPLLGMRLKAERARPALAGGLAVGAAGFGALGVFPGAHPVLLAAFAFIAGAGPAAAPGGLRALLTSLVPERVVTQALSYETTLTFAIWAISPAAVAGLALSLDPRLPLLLGAVLMAAGCAGMWRLPVGWEKEAAEPGGESMVRTVARAWPVFVTGAASLSLLGLAELILPALLEQRGIGVGWAGPLLAGFAVGSGVGAFLYGLRGSWPGSLPVQSLVLMCSVSGCVVLVAVLPSGVLIGIMLGIAGVLQAGSMMTRQLTLRAVLPSSALAAAYSVMYAAVGAGYAAAGTLSGALLKVTSPSLAILAGVGLTVVLTVVGAVGERATRGGRGKEIPLPAPSRKPDGTSGAAAPGPLPGSRPSASSSNAGRAE